MQFPYFTRNLLVRCFELACEWTYVHTHTHTHKQTYIDVHKFAVLLSSTPNTCRGVEYNSTHS